MNEEFVVTFPLDLIQESCLLVPGLPCVAPSVCDALFPMCHPLSVPLSMATVNDLNPD